MQPLAYSPLLPLPQSSHRHYQNTDDRHHTFLGPIQHESLSLRYSLFLNEKVQ